MVANNVLLNLYYLCVEFVSITCVEDLDFYSFKYMFFLYYINDLSFKVMFFFLFLFFVFCILVKNNELGGFAVSCKAVESVLAEKKVKSYYNI